MMMIGEIYLFNLLNSSSHEGGAETVVLTSFSSFMFRSHREICRAETNEIQKLLAYNVFFVCSVVYPCFTSRRVINLTLGRRCKTPLELQHRTYRKHEQI